MAVKQVIIKRTIRAPREKVFNAFSDPEIMRKWFFPGENWSADVNNDFKVGASYTIKMYTPNGEVYTQTGEYRVINPPEKIVFTWNSSLVQDTLVTVTFQEVGENTEITLTHDLFPNKEVRDKHEDGWTGCLNNLGEIIGSKET